MNVIKDKDEVASFSQKSKKIDGIEVKLEDDPYLIDLHKRLVDARNERLKVEKETEKLNNRLGFLKNQEDSKEKEIENLKTVYKKKYDTMKKIEEDLTKKVEIKELKEEELKKQKEFNKKFKTEISNHIKENREIHLNELIKEKIRTKEIKKRNEELIKNIKLEEQNINKNKYDFIKTQKNYTEEKKRAKVVRFVLKIRSKEKI